MKKLLPLLLVPFFLSAPTGCSKKSSKTIGLSILTSRNDFFNVIANTMKEEAKKHGYEVIVDSGEEDVVKQAKQVDNFIQQKVSAIVLCPCDSKAIGKAIIKANNAGIPVFTADIKCDHDTAKVACHVATDNLGGGRLAGKAMIQALGEAGGKVVILDYPPVESCQKRLAGFEEVLDKHNATTKNGKIEIVQILEGNGDKEKSFNSTQDAITNHEDLAGIFAINDPSALGAYEALKKAKLLDQVKIIGFDGQPDGKKAIREGKIFADPVQFPDRIARKTVNAIMNYLAGKQVPTEILIPTELYGPFKVSKKN